MLSSRAFPAVICARRALRSSSVVPRITSNIQRPDAQAAHVICVLSSVGRDYSRLLPTLSTSCGNFHQAKALTFPLSTMVWLQYVLVGFDGTSPSGGPPIFMHNLSGLA